MAERLAQGSRRSCYPGAGWTVTVLRLADGLAIGLGPTRELVSPWPAGVPALFADRGRLNRAEPKLWEAIFSFGLRLPTRGRALDLGSSQGGWSRVLLQSGLQVTAVDPREPDHVLLTDPRFQHRAMTAEAFLETDPPPFDFLSNDMILPPGESARLMVRAAPYLKVGCSAIMTLKVGSKGRLAQVDQALRILRKVYKIPRLKQLHHNGLELTAWLIRRP